MKNSRSVPRWILVASATLLGSLFWHSLAAAQTTGTIQGRVLAEGTSAPVSGAQIQVGGTTIGALANARGAFVIPNVPVGQRTLRVSRLGYADVDQAVAVAAGQTVTVDIVMSQTAIQMGEIIVTGTGQPTERRRLSADVAVVDADDIAISTASNVTELLQGRVPGAQINAVSAQPGSAGLMSLRGPTSVIAAATPIVYIDGVRVDNKMGIGSDFGGEQTSALADLAVTDIERIEVTKGGAASTLFGADAATGVIQIFTKRGSGQSRVTASIEQGVDLPETKFIQDVDFVYPAEKYPQLRQHPSWDPNFVKNTVLKSGRYQSYQVSALGGTPLLGYNLSGRLQASDGIQRGNQSNQYSLHSGLQAELSETVSADFSGSYLRHNFHRVPNGTTTTGVLTNIEVGDFLSFVGKDNLGDALDIYYKQDIIEQVDRFTLSSSLNWNPSSLFSTRATLGVDKRSSTQRHHEDIDMTANARLGAIIVNNRDFTGVTMDLRGTLTYQMPLFTSSSTTAGFQGFRESETTANMTGQDFALPGSLRFNQAARITATEGGQQVFNGGIYLLQQLGIRDQLFLEAGVRFDGNTAFGSNVSYQAYPKLGASYDLAAAGILPAFIGTARLRGNYGETGKFPPPFLRDRTFRASPFRGESAPRFDNPGNIDLKAERVATVEGGLDVSFLDERVGLNLTAYRATTTDALFVVNEQPATGQLSQLRNVGTIRNQGVEANVNLQLVETSVTGWSLNLTYSKLKNEVIDLGGVPPFELRTNERREFGRVQEGYPIGVRYMNYPIDTNGDGKFDGTERGVVRHPETGEHMTPYPTSTGSIASQITFPGVGVALSAQADWSRGAVIQDYAAIWSYFNNIPRIPFPMRYNLQGGEVATYNYLEAMNYILVKGDYFKIRELSARYELPETLAQRIGGDRASLSLSVRNAYTWVPSPQSLFSPDTARPFLVDPELHGFAEPTNSGLQLGGSQSVALPPPTAFRVAFHITF
jgi:outer membrane receptor protein involved in Fe transport